MPLTLIPPPKSSANKFSADGLIAAAKKIADDYAASRKLNEQALLGQHQEDKPKPSDVITADPSLFVDAKVLVSISEIERRLKPPVQAVTPNPTASIVTANPTSIPTIKVTTDGTTTTTTIPLTWSPTSVPTITVLPTSFPTTPSGAPSPPILPPSAAPSPPSVAPSAPSVAPSAPSVAPTTPSPRPTAVVQTETTRPTSTPTENTPSTTTTTTLFAATLPPTSSPTTPSGAPSAPSPPSVAPSAPIVPPSPAPTVGVTFIPTVSPTPAPTPVIYTSGPTATPTLIAGFNKSSTTTTTTSANSTEIFNTTTALAISTTSTTTGGSASTTSTTTSSPSLSVSPSLAPTVGATSNTTYGVNQSTTITTTTTKPTSTSPSVTSTSTTTTTTSYAKDEKNITATTTTSLTPTTSPTSSPTPEPSWLPTASASLNTSIPTNSPTGAPTNSPAPTYYLGTVAPTPAPLPPPNLPASAAPSPPNPVTPTPTDSTTTTNFATTTQGTTTVTTTSLPSISGQSTGGYVSTTFTTTSATPTTTLSLLATTSNAFTSTSTNKSLGWTNTTAVASLPRQGTDAATVHVALNNNNDGLSLTSKLVITSIALGVVAMGVAAGFQLVRWGSRLRDDIDLYREKASEGRLFAGNYDSMLKRGSTYANRLSHWIVSGKWGGFFPNDKDPNSLGQVINEIIQTDVEVKQRIASAGGGAVIVPSVPGRPLLSSVATAATQTLAPSMLDLEIGQESRVQEIRAVYYGNRRFIDLDNPDGRRLGIDPPSIQAKEIPLIQTKDIRIVELWCLITKAQQLPYSDQSRTDMLMQALVKYQQIISSGHIYLYDFDTLQDTLMPTLLKELSDLTLMAADSDPSARLAGAQTLNVGHLTGTQFTWDANFTPSGAPVVMRGGKGYVELMDISKAVFSNQPLSNRDAGYSKATKSVVLDTQHAQYVASDANEFISIGSDPFATGPTNYNVAGMAGNDIFSISADALGKNSYVNLIGGGGKNTYLIYGKGSWSQLASTIHIWDFDSSKDTIMFMTSDGPINLNETKRTLFSSAYKYAYSDNEQVRLAQTNVKMSFFSAAMANWTHSAGAFKTAEHEFTGEGMPVIVADETDYSTRNPNSIFSALKTSQLSNSNGQLPLSEVVNTQFGKLNTTWDHHKYKVHLTAGKSYVFTMSHSPYEVGDAVLVASLALKDAQNTAVAYGKLENGNSRIDYLALKDGDFYLDASGSLPGLLDVDDDYGLCLLPRKDIDISGSFGSYQGKYAISTVEIPHQALQIGYTAIDKFDGVVNHLGYKMRLSAGDYVAVSFFIGSGRADGLSISDSLGNNIGYKFGGSAPDNQIFMAQKTGDYFIDVTDTNFIAVNAVKRDVPTRVVTSKLTDIEGSIATCADLSVNNLITSNINSKSDHDWFRVQLDAGKTYEFEAVSKNPSDKLFVHLGLKSYNGLMNIDYPRNVVDSMDKTGNVHSKMTLSPVASDTYYIDVYGMTTARIPSCSGDYTLSYHVI